MCGRFALYSRPDALAERFQTDTIPGMEITPRCNIAPSQTVAIVRQDGGHRGFAPVRWGLIPSWAKDIKTGYSMINARAETVAKNRRSAARSNTGAAWCRPTAFSNGRPFRALKPNNPGLSP